MNHAMIAPCIAARFLTLALISAVLLVIPLNTNAIAAEDDYLKYGMTFDREHASEVFSITADLLDDERRVGHWAGEYQEEVILDKVKHLYAAEQGLNRIANLDKGAPCRCDSHDPYQDWLGRQSIYNPVFFRARAGTNAFLRKWARKIGYQCP
jgi:hypothetical protein